MATLLELTQQGDVGTITDESKLANIKLMNPQQLYELWERQPWSAHAIDLSKDVEDWASFDDDMRGHIAWTLSSFFSGEGRVPPHFTGLVRAYESQSEGASLPPQQADGPRHAQHFNRFYEQVLGVDGTFEDRLA